jgi:hypothetical protein
MINCPYILTTLLIAALTSGCVENEIAGNDKVLGQSLDRAKQLQKFSTQNNGSVTSKEASPRFKSYTQGRGVVSAESDQVSNKSQGF